VEAPPVSSLFGRRVILVDDILDEGYTLQGVREWCLEQGATDVRVAVLTVKKHDRCIPGVKADYPGVELPDRFVFGFGMDIDETLRTLPAIYAMKQ
jgi:Hypoxanthine-guanine phosphoribosyltransferase